MYPVLYCLEKALRMGNGSLYKTSRGSRATSLQNESQFPQCPLASVDLLVEMPLDMSSDVAWNILRKQVHLVGSIFSMAASVGRLCPRWGAVQHR